MPKTQCIIVMSTFKNQGLRQCTMHPVFLLHLWPASHAMEKIPATSGTVSCTMLKPLDLRKVATTAGSASWFVPKERYWNCMRLTYYCITLRGHATLGSQFVSLASVLTLSAPSPLCEQPGKSPPSAKTVIFTGGSMNLGNCGSNVSTFADCNIWFRIGCAQNPMSVTCFWLSQLLLPNATSKSITFKICSSLFRGRHHWCVELDTIYSVFCQCCGEVPLQLPKAV